MQRLSIDTDQRSVSEFVRELPTQFDGIEVELDGRVVCEIIPPRSLSPAARDALINRGKELVKRARARNAGVPSKVIEQEIQRAVDQVRARGRS